MPDTAPPEPLRTVPDAIARAADEHGDGTVLRYGDRGLSGTELDERTDALAAGLRASGVEPGDSVCLYMYNSLEYVVLSFALAKLGAVVVPVDTRFEDETLAVTLEKSDAEVVFVDGKTRAAYDAVRNRATGTTTEYFVGDPPADRPYRDYDTLLDDDAHDVADTHDAADATAAADAPGVSVSQSDTCAVVFIQRRATDHPRGVRLPHYAYVNTGWEAARNVFGFDADDCLFTTLPLYSVFTFQLGVMGALLAGAEFVVGDPFDPDTFWDEVEAHGATVVLYLGRMLSVLYNQETGARETPVDLVVGHGFGFGTDEALIENVQERFGVTVLEGYGVTQTATLATYNRPGDNRPGSSGRPVSYATVDIVDEDGWPVDAGETGEIVVRPTRPNAMFQGFYGEPERTVEVCRNQWIHTGDVGYVDEEGFLHLVANEDNSIYRGQVAGRVSSLEVESVIDAMAGVRDAAVVGVQNRSGEEDVKAVVVPEDDATLSPVEVCQYCERRLPYLKVPRFVEVRAQLPRNSAGKVRKGALRDEGAGDAWDRKNGYEFSR